jgi:hypothetical protein
MKVGLLVRIEAKPEYADEMEAMLRGAQELAEQSARVPTSAAFQGARCPMPVTKAFTR